MRRAAALVPVALVLAACGGKPAPVTTTVTRTAAAPKLPAALAAQLAADADAVSAALDANDACAAHDAAVRLRNDTVAAINAGQVPPDFQESLTGKANDLAERIQCVQVTVPAPPSGPAHGHGHGKGKDNQQGGDNG